MKKYEDVTIAKAIGIILMVIGHSGLGGYPTHFIYLFHMPLFFFLSGYCFKESYLCHPKDYILRRLKGAYLSYVKWSLIFLLLHNVFAYEYIYDNTYTMKEMMLKAIHVSTGLWDTEQLLGGFWFLKSLFWGSFMFYGIKRAFKYSHDTLMYGGGILLTLSMLSNVSHVKIPYWGINETDLVASLFMLIGYEFHKNKVSVSGKIACVGVASMFAGAFFWSQQMIDMKWYIMIPYIFTAVIGSLLILKLSKYLYDVGGVNTKAQKLFIYIGNNTLGILIWHFLCFKLVSLFIINLYNLPLQNLSEFPVLAGYASQGWWIVYSIVGVALPIIVIKLLSSCRLKKNEV